VYLVCWLVLVDFGWLSILLRDHQFNQATGCTLQLAGNSQSVLATDSSWHGESLELED